MMIPDEIKKFLFLTCPHILTAGGELTGESLAAKVREMHKGLSAEDEFAAKVCWLGNCSAIHRLDQTPMPTTEVGGKMRAPDFLVFPIVNDQPLPVLVEVKSHHAETLDFSESYLIVGTPLR